MAKIVILGAGLGGMSAAYEIRAMLGSEHEVTVVGEGPLFNFTPSNPWVAVGWRAQDDILVAVKEPLERRGIHFIDVLADKVLPDDKQLLLHDGRKVDYDYLVVTTGPRLAFERVPGTGPDGYSQSICNGPHAHAAFTKIPDQHHAVFAGHEIGRDQDQLLIGILEQLFQGHIELIACVEMC